MLNRTYFGTHDGQCTCKLWECDGEGFKTGNLWSLRFPQWALPVACRVPTRSWAECYIRAATLSIFQATTGYHIQTEQLVTPLSWSPCYPPQVVDCQLNHLEILSWTLSWELKLCLSWVALSKVFKVIAWKLTLV